VVLVAGFGHRRGDGRAGGVRRDGPEHVRTSGFDVGNRFRKFQEARQQLRVTSLARDVAQEKVRVGLDRYQQKAVLLKDVLQLQTSLAESRYKYQESLLAFWSARAELEKAMGER
jgi:outer membrane protein TolC